MTVLIASQLAGCAGPYVFHGSSEKTESYLIDEYAVMEDGYRLPLLMTGPESRPPRAIVLALHGFNDYSNAFKALGKYLQQRDMLLIAYDQRGFGRTEGRGFWHGTETMKDDMLTMVRLLNTRYRNVPIFLLGESMGGAVLLASLEALQYQGGYAGLILVAPAVWAKETMPWYQQAGMWFFAHTMPWFSFTAKGLDITPSDNVEMLRALGRDPLILKNTRADTVYGLSDLMDQALSASSRLLSPALILYGRHDEIIPREPTCAMLQALPRTPGSDWRFILYKQGYHMLTRDLQAETVFVDIYDWMLKRLSGEGESNTFARPEDLAFVCD